MTIQCHSERYKYQKQAIVKYHWLKKPDAPSRLVVDHYDRYMNNDAIPDDMKDKFHKYLRNFMVNFLVERYEKQIELGLSKLATIQKLIRNQPLEAVYTKMIHMIPIWKLRYNGPVVSLKHINNSQSVHESFIVKHTNDGVTILLSTTIPSGQRTLSEIECAWSGKNIFDLYDVMNDMKDWGNRERVMSETTNLYRNVLRGLWAMIKSVSDVEIKAQLIQRLWEESKESVQMCADGHIARLINVMVGYDERFGNNIKPMEYFQNNIALIAASDAPVRFKIDQATRLMNEVNMPLEDRGSWLEAL